MESKIKVIEKRKVGALVAAALAIALVAASWAYFTSTASIDNELGTKTYGARTVENFTPGSILEPGTKINKSVGVQNTGDYDLVVRVKLDEQWSRNGVVFKSIAFDGSIDTVIASSGPDAWTAKQKNDTDGETPAEDETVVYKELNLGTEWVKGSDCYYYYTSKLGAGKTTLSNLMESIRMASNADVGAYQQVTYYSTADRDLIAEKIALGTIQDSDYGWTTTKPSPASLINFIRADNELIAGKLGYSDADYTLTVTTEVLQATNEAVSASWAMSAPDLASIKDAWALPSN